MDAASTSWLRVAASTAVTTTPRPVVVGTRRLVVVRLHPGGPAIAVVDRCPHRLVPLSAGTVVEGRLRCAYHGWRFDGAGRCVEVPSLGPSAHLPPRARLETAAGVREEDGWVWVRVPEPGDATPAAGAAPAEGAEVLTNVATGLLRGWHPVSLSTEVGPASREVLLVGRSWTLRRVRGRVTADPAPYGLRERWGVVWLAPRQPVVELFDDPDAEDARYVGGWLAPARTPAPAGVVADNFLDVAHFPFVHTGTFGADAEPLVPAYEVAEDPDGCRSEQVQWFDNPNDPGVAAGIRPVRQRRRASYVYRAPFQLMLRLAELEAGAVKTILFFVQPESLASSRIYTKMLLSGIGGVERPGPAVLASEIAFEEAVLAEDLALQRHMTLTGLPLRPGAELHVRADRLGLALRRVLRQFVERAG